MDLRSPDYISLCFLGFVLMLTTGIQFPLISPFAATLTTSLTLIGLVATAFWVARMASEVPMGVLSDRTSKIKLIMIGIFITGVSSILTSFVVDIFELIMLRVPAALGSVLFFLASLSYVAERFPSESRGKALGILQAVEFTTVSAASSLGGWLGAALGFRLTFAIGGVILLCALISIIILKPFSKQKPAGYQKALAKTPPSPHGQQKVPKALVFEGLSIASFSIFAIQFPECLITVLAPLYALKALGMNLVDVGIMLAPRGIGIGVGAVLGGLLFDKLYPRWHLLNYALAFMTMELAILLFITTNALVILSFAVFLTGLSFGLVYSTTPAVAAAVVTTKSTGSSMGIWRTFFDLGGMMAPMIIMSIAEHESLAAPFHATLKAFIFAVGFFVAFSLYRGLRPSAQSSYKIT